MRIKTLPENYAGVLGSVIYEIDQCAVGDIITIGIPANNNDQIVGEKRLRGETEYKINVSNYLSRWIEVEPVADKWSGFGKAADRSCGSRIVLNGQMSAATYASGGIKKCPLNTDLSDAPQRINIAYGEKDEIAVAAPGIRLSAKVTARSGQGSEEIELGSVLCGEGIYVMVVDIENIGSYLSSEIHEYREMTVEIRDKNTVVAKREYRISEPESKSMRLCWQNAYGQVDYYTFSVLEESISVGKSRVYVSGEYTTTSVEEKTMIKLVSPCEPRKTLDWLAGIVSSPKVWMKDTDGFTKVDVVTEKVQISTERPGSISLTIINARKLTLKQ